MPLRIHSPQKSAPAAFRLTSAKKRVLALVVDYFCLTVKQAAELLGKDPKNDSDLRTTKRTFTLLYRERVLNRLPYWDLELNYPVRSFVYGLTDRSAKEYGGKTFDEHSERTLDHEIAITRFHIALTRAFKEPRYRVRWYQSNIKRSVAPDAVFSITDTTKPADRNTDNYFLEIERAKIGNIVDGEPSIIRKLAKYGEIYDSPQCEKEWGFRKFRVITVVRNADKQYNLCERLSEKYPHRMFWITTEPHVREGIGGEVFRTSKDFPRAAYSFIPAS